jgi:hypothetical protein
MTNMDQNAKEIIALYKSMTGRTLIPEGTDPTRTYQYRYIAKFLRNMESASWDTTKKVAYYAIQYAKENKDTSVWTRGLWILTKSNIIDIAYKKAKEADEQRGADLSKVVQSKKFAKAHNFDFAHAEEDAFPNIVMWHETGKISLTYMAMSESCKKTLRKLADDDKAALPSQDEIAARRIKCLLDVEYRKRLKRIMGRDYIKLID